MNYNFNTDRNPSLDLALSVKDILQRSLDAAKHGYSEDKLSIITSRNLTYGSAGKVRTIAIDYNSCDYLAMLKWYSYCNVKLSDLNIKTSRRSNSLVISVDISYMKLYMIGIDEIIEGIGNHLKDKQRQPIYERLGDIYSIEIKEIIYDIHTKVIRRTVLDHDIKDISVVSIGNVIYSIISGDAYNNVYQLCDDVLCTNISVMVNYVGKVRATMTCVRHCTDYTIQAILARMLHSNESVEDFSNISNQDHIKKLTVRGQLESLKKAVEMNSIDNLESQEAKLIVGSPL